MFKFGVKSAILGGAVYYTIEKGVWKDSATTTALYEELERGMSPYVGELKEQIPYSLPALPKNDRISYLFKYYWNTGVKATFRFLVDLPDHASDAASKTYNFISTSLEATEPSANKENVEKQ
ncbi:protein QIL1 domain-containing protein [Phthorimaea operculella]|nr:protein QIL1 domain-containing protein [Phthorimaea operculella]